MSVIKQEPRIVIECSPLELKYLRRTVGKTKREDDEALGFNDATTPLHVHAKLAQADDSLR